MQQDSLAASTARYFCNITEKYNDKYFLTFVQFIFLEKCTHTLL